MADETLATDISGPNGLPDALQADLDLDNTFLPVDNVNGETVNVSVRQLLTAFGNLTFTGNVTGSGIHGSIGLTIANGVVTFAKMQNVNASKLIGRGNSGAGAPQEITIGTGLSMSGSTLQADSAGQVPPSAHLYSYQRFGLF